MPSPTFRGTLLAATAALLAVGAAIPGLPRANAASEAAPAAASAAPLILSQAEVQGSLGRPGVRLVDVRPPADYAKGHLPGAVNLPWQRLSVPETDGVRNEFAPDDELARQFGLAGLGYDDTIILYAAGTFAGRAFVAFEYAGFPRLHVLNGGFDGWKGEVSTEPATPLPTTVALTRKRDNRVTKDYVAAKVGDARTVIVDGRSADAFRDGHIPTATGIPDKWYLDPASLRRPKGDLLAELAARGLTPDKEVVSYCGSGVAASNVYLVLKDLGFERVTIYDGSWDEWSRDPRAGQDVGLPNYSFDPVALPAAGSLGPRFLAEAEVKSLAGTLGAVVLDVRSPSDFNAGRIPGSVNVFWNDTLDQDRVLRKLDELLALYAAKGVTPDKRVVIFTRGGLQLSHSYLVLKLLGYPRVDAFSGEFEGWDNASYRGLKL